MENSVSVFSYESIFFSSGITFRFLPGEYLIWGYYINPPKSLRESFSSDYPSGVIDNWRKLSIQQRYDLVRSKIQEIQSRYDEKMADKHFEKIEVQRENYINQEIEKAKRERSVLDFGKLYVDCESKYPLLEYTSKFPDVDLLTNQVMSKIGRKFLPEETRKIREEMHRSLKQMNETYQKLIGK